MPFNLLLVTNIPTPYRQSFFASLSELLVKRSGTLTVSYMAFSERNRDWKVNYGSSDFDYFFANSKIFSFSGIETYISISPFIYWLKNSPDITILAGAWHYPANILIVIIGRILKKQVWFWCESNKYTDKSGSYFFIVARHFFYKINKNFLVPGKMSYDYVKNLNLNSRVIFLPNSVEKQYFTKELMESRLDFFANKFNFVTVCELIDRKGILELIDDFDNLVQSKILPESALLHICGTGILKSQIINISKIKPWIKYHGFKPFNDLVKIMQSCCGFILNTKLDPNPLAVNEACCLGLIPIISRMAGNAYEISKISENFDFTFEFGGLGKALEDYAVSKSSDLKTYSGDIKKYASHFQADQVAENLIESIGIRR